MRKTVSFLAIGVSFFISCSWVQAKNRLPQIHLSYTISSLVSSWEIIWNRKEDQDFMLACFQNTCELYPDSDYELHYQGSLVFSSSTSWKSVEIPIVIDYENYPRSWDVTTSLQKKSIQKKSLSCEISAGSDILSYLQWTNILEDELLPYLAKEESYGKSLSEMKGIWGNPEKWYVGAMDFYKGEKSDQWKKTGYWVYEYPMSWVFAHFWYETKIINRSSYVYPYGPQAHLKELLQALVNGNMVQMWWDRCTDPKYEDGGYRLAKLSQSLADAGMSGVNNCKEDFLKNRVITWQYRDRGILKNYQGLIGEHAFYLLGYYGGIDSPTAVIVWDTNTGMHAYHIDEWMRKWGMMDYRSLIIYKKP